MGQKKQEGQKKHNGGARRSHDDGGKNIGAKRISFIIAKVEGFVKQKPERLC